MSPELLSILVLVVMFVVATTLPINIGVLAFVAAFVVGTTVAGMSADDILAGFPGGLAVTIIGVTYLFAMANNNGTIDWLVRMSMRIVRGQVAAIPWVMFAIAGVLTSFGAVSPAAVAIIAPIALGLAYRHQINPLLMGLFVVHGAQAGGFSPIAIYGTITNQVVEGSGLPSSPITLFLASLLVNLAVAAVVFAVLGRGLLGRREVTETGAEPEPATVPAQRTAAVGGPDSTGTSIGNGSGTGTGSGGERDSERDSGSGSPPADTAGAGQPGGRPAEPGDRAESGVPLAATPIQLLTLAGLLVLAVTTLFFGWDPGLAALTIALIVALASPQAQRGAVTQVSWSVVLLITGVLTYIGVLQELGTIDFVSEAVTGLGSALLVALLLCYVGGVVSAFASSTALIGSIIPLAVPFLLSGEIGAVGVVAALAVSTTVVDVSPFSTNGALILANAREEGKERFYRQLLAVGAIVVVLAPLLTWLVLVVPGWL